jgi:hypothetical protein
LKDLGDAAMAPVNAVKKVWGMAELLVIGGIIWLLTQGHKE